MSDLAMSDRTESTEPRAHARIVYLGPVSPHWEVYGDWGDRQTLDEFRARCLARLVLLPREDPQFRRNRERIVRDAEREMISIEWDLGVVTQPITSSHAAEERAEAAEAAAAESDEATAAVASGADSPEAEGSAEADTAGTDDATDAASVDTADT
ncbi:MAG: hypothetical protein ABJH68_21425 [Ilumatobacter sp.]|uniref:hypothetical protein n=1 Tax=Ilumatobacter sp. TaxID=1967498 RepID=UPI003299E81E